MSAPAPSPFPWRLNYDEPFCPELLDANGKRVQGISLDEDDADYPGGDLNDTIRANFKVVIARVNAHDELIEALKKNLFAPGYPECKPNCSNGDGVYEPITCGCGADEIRFNADRARELLAKLGAL